MLILMMPIAPAHIAMSIPIHPVAVLETIRPVILLDPSATRQVEESNHYTQAEQRHPIRIFHLITPVYASYRSLASAMPFNRLFDN
jgi:hypothetical protein